MPEEILFKGKFTLLQKIIFLLISILMVDIVSFIIEPFVFLSENQILYLMSTSAQVVASLFGLILTAYAIIDPKLKFEAQSNEESEESLIFIRKEYHSNIIVLSILCASTIISCLITLGNFEVVPKCVVSMLLNQSLVFCVGSLVLFLSFGCSLLNPNKLSELNRRALVEVNNDYKEENLKFEPFVEFYNKLEYLIITYATELESKDIDNSIVYNKEPYRRMHMVQALKILQMNKIIDENIFVRINELRRYRNALVHSIEREKVNLDIYNNLQEMYNFFLAVYEKRHDDIAKEEKRKELSEFSERISQNQKEKVIQELFDKNPQITIKELSDKLGYKQTAVKRKIDEMCKKGLLVKENGEYKVIWKKQDDITDKEK